MRFPTLVGLATAAAGLVGCLESGPYVSAPPETKYADLGPSQLSLSGVVYDPEAFFYSMAMFTPDPAFPNDVPPPALFAGTAYLMESSIPGTRVSLVKGASVVMTSEPSTETGSWNVRGFSQDETEFNLVAEPPAAPLALGGGALPEAKYFKTRTLNPVIPSRTYCMNQVAISVGDTGALRAIADFKRSQGTNTTVADLLDPARSGGVLLVWVYSPSFYLNMFTIPSGEISLSADKGEVFALEWAPPGSFEGQTPLGYFGAPGKLSSTGYFAVVMPPNASGPVHLTMTDTVTDNESGRPYEFPELTWNPTPGVTFHRTFGVMPAPPPNPDAEPVPPFLNDWACTGE